MPRLNKAPSADNTQPWSFLASEKEGWLEVYCEPSYDPPEMNSHAVLSLSAVGAVIENARLFARSELGHDLEIEWNSGVGVTDKAFKVATLRLGRALHEEEAANVSTTEISAQVIFERHSYRGKLDGTPLTQADRQVWQRCLSSIRKDYPEVQLRSRQTFCSSLRAATHLGHSGFCLASMSNR
ncbi:MAG: hypothetical protein ACRCYY_04915 [Trueperaceae bacterium]